MNKFFITLFINNRFCQYRLDDLIQNSFNGYINGSFVIGNKAIYFPVQVQNETYSLHSKSSLWEIKYGNDVVREKQEIKHGDYYVISKDDTTCAALVTSYSALGFSGKAYSLKSDKVFIGRANDMNIVLDLNTNIPRKLAAIYRDDSGKHHIEDLSGKIGIYINGERVTSKELMQGDEIYIMGTSMIYFPNMLILPLNRKVNGLAVCEEFDVLPPADTKDSSFFVRTPRILKSQEDGKVVIDAPTSPQKSKEIPFILTAGPSMTMSLAMIASLGVTVSNAINGGQFGSLVTSGVMTVSMLAGALLWPGLLRKYNKRQEEANERYRQARYSSYLAKKEQEICGKYERNTRILNETLLPSPQTLISFVSEKNRHLWERVPGDEDFLTVRLGIGEKKFGVEIQAPNKGFVLEDDVLVDNAVELADKYRTLINVPIGISLTEKKVVGVVGDAVCIANTMITNMIALHSSDEVKLLLLYNPKKIKELQWANDLPHVWSGDRKQRYVATNKAEARSLLSLLDEYIAGREASLTKDELRLPYFVVLVVDETLVEDIPFRKHLVNAENKLGLSTVFFGKRFNNIPKECNAIIQKEDDVCGIYIKNENNNQFIRFEADEVSEKMMQELSDSIYRIKVKTEKGRSSIPERVTFLDMYKAGNISALEILNHWSTNASEKSLAAPIGVKAGGEAFLLDIHEKHHGCHGLVAGTTGSGKSEFLQAYILSMMINYSPNEVAFVLVDFKGGDMARPFLKAPHLSATISNLSGNTLNRALISLEAEVKSRQNIFNKAAELLGIDKIDINSYHKHFKEKKLGTPLPHLIIVIDEFAQLKSQHSEFMSKLIDIAQVGRSLGIHLILATQRPSGVVDPQIWSNSRFKVCLKVLDKQDSMDMINKPEAALIKQPGRAYVQVGYDEVFEQIQSGYSGADYVPQDDYIDEESVTVKLVNWPAEQIRVAKKTTGNRKSSRTQLEEIVMELVNTGNIQGIRTRQLWLPPLPLSIRLEECIGHDFIFDKGKWDTESFGNVICGLADLPDVQKQEPYAIDFIKSGHIAIYGSSGYGKSTLIQTILFAYAQKFSPELFHVFVLDFDGGSLASVSAMPHCIQYSSGDDESQVEHVLSTIQSVIMKRRELFLKSHCANYESYMENNGGKLPLVVLVLDNYAAFRERMYRSEDSLIQLISAARSCGVYLLVTGSSKGAIFYKITEQISHKIVLGMNDSGAYRDILNVPIPIEPANTKGRALTVVDKKAVEVQFAVPFDSQNETNRTGKMKKMYNRMAESSTRSSGDASFTHTEAALEEKAAEPVSIRASAQSLEPLESESEALVIGYEPASESPQGFALQDFQCVFIGDKGNRNVVCAIIKRLAENTEKQVYLVSAEEPDELRGTVEFVKEPDVFIREAASDTTESDRIIVIDGFCDFYDRISDESLFIFERALSRGLNYNVITFDNMLRLSDYRDTGLYVKLVRTEKGAVVGGAVDDALAAALTSRIYEISKEQRERGLPAGQAFIYSSGKYICANAERRG